MKKLFVLAVLLIVIGASAQAKSGVYLSRDPVVGTFAGMSNVVDGSLVTYAISGKVEDESQFLTIDLQSPTYIGSVKVYWDANALSQNYSIRVSSDKKNWFTEFSGLDASEGVLDQDNGTKSQVVSMNRYMIPVRYLQIYIPAGSVVNSPKIKIAEIQVTQAENLSFKLLDSVPYVITDNKAIIVYHTSIGALGGEIDYGTDQTNLDQVAGNMESGVINSVTLTGLTPRAVYYYKVKTWDANGNSQESTVSYLQPARINLALHKSVSGTFTALPPKDDMVDKSTDVLSRVTDGGTSYFTGMATSGPVPSADQSVIVNLGASYPLTSIVTYWRALAYPESFRVLASDDKNKWTEIALKLNAGEGAFARSDAGDPMRVVNTPAANAKARYVEVLIDKGSPVFTKHADWDFVQMMELEVY